MDLEFKVEAFSGPLELLLHLIEKNKVNIYDIPIVDITEQYIAYISKMDEDMDTMSEFLVMAATLIKIKSKMLLPKEEKVEEEVEDPRAELVKRLIEYKKIRYAAQELKDMEIGASQAFYRRQELPNEVMEYKPIIDASEVIADTNIDLAGLNKIFNEVMKRMTDKVDPVRSKFGKIEREKISVEDKIIDIRDKIRGLSGIHFRSLLMAGASKFDVVVTFLAILELMKSGFVSVRQNAQFGEIYLDSLEG